MARVAAPLREELGALFVSLTERISEQQMKLGEQEKRIALLEEARRLDALARFAAKADRVRALPPGQLELLALEPGLHAQEVDAAVEAPPEQSAAEAAAVSDLLKARRYKLKPHPGRAALPGHLRREDILIDEPPPPLADGTAPTELRRDTTERLAVQPAEYYVERITTVSYIFAGHPDKGVHAGRGPAALTPKGLLGPSVVIDLIVAKYADHQPVYRQVMGLVRDQGIALPYATADRAVIAAAALTIPLADAMLGELKAGNYLQADETRVPVLDPRVAGKAATGWLWTYSHPRGAVVYRHHPGRGGKYARGDLEGFRGWLQSDGYQVYQTLAALFGESVIHCACLSHVRRKFVEIVRINADIAGFERSVATAGTLLRRIDELYEIERELKGAGAHEAQRREERAARSLPLFDQLMDAMERTTLDAALLPGSALSKACTYTLKLRRQLRSSLENGITEIDNNRCEQSIRPIALGRKNWLHVGSPEAAPAVAAIISVIESCKRMGINVRTYLAEVLPLLAAAHPDKVTALAATLTPRQMASRTLKRTLMGW